MEEKALTKTERTVDQIQKVDGILNVDQLKFLFSKTPKKHQYQRPGKGGDTWTYVTGTYIKKVLNMMFGWNWSFEVDKFDVNMEAKQCIVLGRLEVTTKGQRIMKMQFGRADIKFKKNSEQPLDLGNDLKAATTDALKKCASELGIAGDIYGKNEFKSIEVTESKPSDDQLNYLSELLETANLPDDKERQIKFTLPSDTMRDVQHKIHVVQEIINQKSVPASKEIDYMLRKNQEKAAETT